MTTLVEYGGVCVVNETAANRRVAAIRWARRALGSLEVVVLEVETLRWMPGSDTRSLCGLAIIDTAGVERLNTPLRPRLPSSRSQDHHAHHSSPEMTSGAPSFRSILPILLRATTGVVIATFNAPSVYELIMSEVRETGMDPRQLGEPSNWRCISQARSDWFGQPDHYLPPHAAERALGRCHASLKVLRQIATAGPYLADRQ